MRALDRQRTIFLRGTSGRRPTLPTDYDRLEAAARRRLSAEAFAYIAGGAGAERTVAANRAGFDSWQLLPRMLRNVEAADTGLELFGRRWPLPIFLSPVGVLDLAHPDADLAVARAAATRGVPMIFSNQASVAMETTATALNTAAPYWFQLYWSKRRELVASFVERAERCGCEAIVVTLDTTMLGWRPRDLELAYLPFLRGRGLAQYTSDPVFQRLLEEPAEAPPGPTQRLTWSTIRTLIQLMRNYPGPIGAKLRTGRPLRAVRTFISTYTNPALTWDDLPFLRDHTRLPILLKGILHPDDARRAVDAGMDGIIISNHGGRQVDGAVSAIGQLPAIAAAVEGRVPLLLDSGIRTGADILKALALGATAVGIGRPYVYGLALAGAAGVGEVIDNLAADFELTMRLCGIDRIAGVDRTLLCS